MLILKTHYTHCLISVKMGLLSCCCFNGSQEGGSWEGFSAERLLFSKIIRYIAATYSRASKVHLFFQQKLVARPKWCHKQRWNMLLFRLQLQEYLGQQGKTKVTLARIPLDNYACMRKIADVAAFNWWGAGHMFVASSIMYLVPSLAHTRHITSTLSISCNYS